MRTGGSAGLAPAHVGDRPSLSLASTSADTGEHTIGDRLDGLGLSRLHLAILFICALGFAADIAEVVLSGVLAAVFLGPPYATPQSAVSLLLASVYAGGAIGAPVTGWLADRHGRRVVLQSALATIAVSSLAASASGDIGTMTAFRFISGFAIGAYPPLTASYLSEILPPARRGALMLACAGVASLGAPAVILLLRALSPSALGIEAWRWALAAGGAAALLAAALFSAVPDSPRWLAARGRHTLADRACQRLERSDRARRYLQPAPPCSAGVAEAPAGRLDSRAGFLRRSAFLSVLYLLGPWATLGFPLLSAAVMLQKGFSVGDSVLFAGLAMLGPTLGNFALALIVDRVGRRPLLTLCALAMVGLGAAFTTATALVPLVLIGLAFNLTAAVYGTILALYAAEIFPTKLRATATVGAWGVGRLVSIFVPLALLPLLTGYGPAAMFGVITATLLLSAIMIVFAGPPEPARRNLA